MLASWRVRSDFELLDAWALGDKRAAKELIDRHFDAVYRFLANKLRGGGVEDVVQDTFLACVQGRDKFRREASFRTFVFATARNVLLYHFRKQRRAGEPFDPEQLSAVDLAPGPSSVVVHKDEQRLLLEALRALPLEYQIALELYHWEGLSGPELATVLEITEAALRSRLHRAKVALRKQLEIIASSGVVLESTLADLDQWAASLRAAVRR
ncbi:MAG: RNA polymerase sigma factor [Nannocystaceae bacterium]|nr:RNA polymerase sigma factor [Nannocystaceae bacterium]